MCGIAGIITNRDINVDRALTRMLEMQIHRGPDEGGKQITIYKNGIVGFGHRRLSIIDLSPAGHQPMIEPETGAQVVFNGEIYNFQDLRKDLEREGVCFRGHSDTEVLLHGLVRWGQDFLKRLAGMYAFAFFKPHEGEVLLARDPLGIKPLYVASLPGVFVFASEIRAIMSTEIVSSHPDRRALAGLLAYGAIQEPCTFFESIKAFPRGCYKNISVVDLESSVHRASKKHWSFPEVSTGITEEDVLPEILQRMNVSVREHLISDVPIGIFLSSGLDSTVIAGLAVNHSPKVRTYTVGFTDTPDVSEANLARETAEVFGTEHTEVNITFKDAEKIAMSWLQNLDQPSVDGLNTYIISQAAKAQGITVALSGLGADELFGGYSNNFSLVPRILKMKKRFSFFPVLFWMILAKLMTLNKPEAVRQKAEDMACADASILDLFLSSRRCISNKWLQKLGVDSNSLHLTKNFIPPESLEYVKLNINDDVGAVSQMVSIYYMGNTLLHDTDVNSMAHSLEIRVPFLDRRVLDFVYSLPGNIRVPNGVANKYLIRQCFEGLLREDLRKQKKRGFSLPIGSWIVGPLREICEESLKYLKSMDILHPDGIDTIWNSFIKAPESLRMARAFNLCVLGFFCKHNKV
jgi:asparagine synthase (glutamine-hydrolysing)